MLRRPTWTVAHYCTTVFGYTVALTGALLLVPLWAKRLGATPAEVGLISSAHAAHQILLRLPFGLLTDRLGEVGLLRAGLLQMGGALVLLVFSTTILMLVASQVLSGFSRSLFWTAGDVYASRLEGMAPGAIGYYRSAASLAGIASPALIGAVVGRWGFPAAAGVLAGIIGLTVILSAALPGLPRGRREESPPPAAPVWDLLRSPGMVTASLAALLTASVLAVSMTFFPVHFLERGLTLSIIGLAMSARALAQTITGAMVARSLAARWRPLFALACLAAGLGFGGAFFVRSAPLAFAVVAGAGICQGITHPLATYLASASVDDRRRGLGMGINGTFFSGGLMAGPVLFGLLAEGLSLPVAFVVFGGVLAGFAVAPSWFRGPALAGGVSP